MLMPIDAFIERVLDPLAQGSALWERALLMVNFCSFILIISP